MVLSTKNKAKTSSSPRLYSYLNGLQREFKLKFPSVPNPSRRFDILVGGLRGEFELMALEIESLQEERDELKAKVEALTKELQVVRHVCERCREARNPLITPSSQFKLPAMLSKSHHKPNLSPRVVNPTRPATQNMTQKPHSNAITTNRHSFQTTSQRTSGSNVPRSQCSTMSSPAPTSVDPDSHTWSITFDDKIEKELGVEVAHALSHDYTVYGVNFSQDGKYVAAGCADGRAYIYTVQTGTLICVLRDLSPDSGWITKVCFSPDGMYLATGAGSGYIYFWAISQKHIRNAFKGHTGFIHSLGFSPKGRYLVSTSNDTTIRIWNLRDGAAHCLIEDNSIFLDRPHYRSAIFSPDGRHVAASHRDGMVRLWCVRTRQLVRRVNAHMNWVNDIAFMPDGERLVSGRRDGTLKFWDISSLVTNGLRAVDDLDEYGSGTKDTEGGFFPIPGNGPVVSAAVTPDGRWVVSSMESSIRIWDSRNAAMQCILETSDNLCVETVDASSVTRHFASGDDGGTMTIWRY